MFQRVMPELMGLKNIVILNDEGHHCYREKPPQEDEENLKGDEHQEAERNNEAARLWISALEAVNCKLGVAGEQRRYPPFFFQDFVLIPQTSDLKVELRELFISGIALTREGVLWFGTQLLFPSVQDAPQVVA